VLTQFSGIRRLPIVDLEQWRRRRLTGPEVIRQNHNSGLDWLAAHRDVILALAFRARDWRGTLAPPDALLKLMKARADDQHPTGELAVHIRRVGQPSRESHRGAPRLRIRLPVLFAGGVGEQRVQRATAEPDRHGSAFG
jgi:hypothetical protein